MNRLLQALSVALLFLHTQIALSQAPNWKWMKSFGGPGNDVSYGVISDAAGNIIVTGSYENTVDFDPGAGTTNLSSAGILDAFVSKYDSSGNFIWTISIGGAGSDVGYDVACDPNGFVYVTGRYNGTVDFDPGPGVSNLVSNGNMDAFIAKYDPQGVLVWAKSVGGSGDDQAFSITLDNATNIYVCGYFQSSADFDPGTGSTVLNSNGGYDAFVMKLENTGGFYWARSFGAVLFDSALGVATDATGNVYTTGHFNGLVDFDPGAPVVNLPPAGGDDVFISKLDGGGNYIWAKALGGNQTDWSQDMVSDAAGNVFTTGRFRGAGDFDPGLPVNQLNANSNSYSDAYVSKLNDAGGYAWAYSVGGAQDDAGYSITLDPSGNVFVTGIFKMGVDMDPGPGTNIMTSFSASNDAFITKTDSAGNYLWTKRLGGADNELCHEITTDASGKLIATGSFASWFVLADADTINNTTTNGTADIFLGKLDTAFVSGIETVTAASFSVYPNPAKDIVQIVLNNPDNKGVSVEIFDITGRTIYNEENITAQKFSISTREFSPGSYFVKVISGESFKVSKVLISE